MDGRGRLAQPLKRSDDARARAGRAPRLRIRSTPLGRLLHGCAAPLIACRARRAASVRSPRSPSCSAPATARSAATTWPIFPADGTICATAPPMPSDFASPRRRSPATMSSAAARCSPPPGSPRIPRCRSSTWARRARGSRRCRGCAGDAAQVLSRPARNRDQGARRIRAVAARRQGVGCRRRRRAAAGLRQHPLQPSAGCGRRRRRDPRARLPGGARRLSGAGRQSARRAGRRAALEPAAEERHRGQAAGNRGRCRAGDAGQARRRAQPDVARYRRDRPAAAGPRQRPALRCRGCGPRRGVEGQEQEGQEGGDA